MAQTGEVAYASCVEVKAAGSAPIRVGDPGFSPTFDGNCDGIRMRVMTMGEKSGRVR